MTIRRKVPAYVATGLAALSALAASPHTVEGQDAGKGTAFSEVTERSKRPVRLYVLNNNFLDVSVYAVRGGSRLRIGVVRSQTGQLFELPVRLTNAGLDVELLASPIGQSDSVTESVQINPGDVVEWRIESSLALSSVAVWSSD